MARAGLATFTASFQPGHPVATDFSIRAEALAVNWTRRDSVSFAATSEEGRITVDKVADSGEETFRNARITGATWHADANWLLELQEGTKAPSVDVASAQLGVRATDGEVWEAGYPGGFSVGAPGDDTLTKEVAVPHGLPLLRFSEAHVQAAGDARIILWGTNLTLTDEAGAQRTYTSGPWASTETGPSRDTHRQLIILKLKGATIDVRQRTGEARLATSTVDVVGQVGVRFEGANGRAALDGSDVGLRGATLDLVGDLELSIQAAQERSRTSVTARGAVSHASLDGKPWTPITQASVRHVPVPSVVLPLFVLATVGGLFAWAGLAWRRHRWSTALDQAESAILNHRPDRARRRLKSHLSRRPQDANAWFLYGATWLQEDDPDRVVRELEPVAQRLSGADRWSISFLLALAHARLRKTDAALNWLADATREPLFRERAAREPDFRFLKDDARFQRLVEADGPAYG